MGTLRLRALCIWLLAAGCQGTTATDNSLGIARFQMDDGPERTTVFGLDADGRVVGQLELVHGRFALEGTFAEGYDDPWVDERRLRVDVLGHSLVWQTEGFGATLQMPAPPPGEEVLSAFLADGHVKPI